MKNILIPTDLTECTRNTLKYAISLGNKSKAKLFFYHAHKEKDQDIKEFGLDFLKNIFSELDLNIKTAQSELTIENSEFSDEQIKRIVEKYNIDLVIMGASHEGLKTTFFGSHVSELINDVACPVLSIPHGYSSINIDRIGYATELSDITTRIKEIVPFAKLTNASIEAFHVYPVFPQIINVEKYDTKHVLSMLQKENNYDKINLHFVKTPFDNEPVTGIREFIKTYKPDMLVMCHKPRGLFDKLLMDSGATISVVKASPIPILALNQKTACKIM